MQVFHHQNMLICQLTTVVSLFLLVLLFGGTFVGNDFHLFLRDDFHAVLLRPFHAALEDELQKKGRGTFTMVLSASSVKVTSALSLLAAYWIELRSTSRSGIPIASGLTKSLHQKIFGIAITPNW